jgi:hypothetical protein
MTAPSAQRYTKLEVALARAMVDKVAPEEAPYFDAIVAATAAPREKPGDQELGFGVPIDADTVSAAILVLSGSVLKFILDTARDAAGQLFKDAAEKIRLTFEQRLFAWFEARFPKPAPISIPPEELNRFIPTIEKQAAAAGLDDEETARLVVTLRKMLEN